MWENPEYPGDFDFNEILDGVERAKTFPVMPEKFSEIPYAIQHLFDYVSYRVTAVGVMLSVGATTIGVINGGTLTFAAAFALFWPNLVLAAAATALLTLASCAVYGLYTAGSIAHKKMKSWFGRKDEASVNA